MCQLHQLHITFDILAYHLTALSSKSTLNDKKRKTRTQRDISLTEKEKKHTHTHKIVLWEISLDLAFKLEYRMN